MGDVDFLACLPDTFTMTQVIEVVGDAGNTYQIISHWVQDGVIIGPDPNDMDDDGWTHDAMQYQKAGGT